MLFCGTIHPLLLSLTSELNLAYMDDMTLGGPESQVAHDVETIYAACMGKEIGLMLNDNKCELISNTAVSVNPAFQNFAHLQFGTFGIFGTIGTNLEQMNAIG